MESLDDFVVEVGCLHINDNSMEKKSLDLIFDTRLWHLVAEDELMCC